MNQKNNTQRNKAARLSAKELHKIKGGYREMPGTISGSLSVRWDEIGIRFTDNTGTSGFTSGTAGTSKPNRPMGPTERMP